eukprot:scaffold35011_cov57-Phaeocystis_antarctica.AAC.3
MDAPQGYDMYIRLLRYTDLPSACGCSLSYIWLQVNPDIPTMDDRLRLFESDASYQFVTNTSASASAYAPELLTCY